MQITYLGHSGFLIEFEDCYCIFDYYVGKLPELASDKPVFVLASHFHPDHYNPVIFDHLLTQNIKEIHGIFSKDIATRRKPDRLPVPFASLNIVTFRQTYELPCGITLQTLLSTDCGVAYLLKHDSCVIYHGGDLNDWSFDESSELYDEQKNKQVRGMYRHEIDLLADLLDGHPIDAAFLPLDPRQGSLADKGMSYFLNKIATKKAYPMHYWNKPVVIDFFLEKFPQYRDIIVYPTRQAHLSSEQTS